MSDIMAVISAEGFSLLQIQNLQVLMSLSLHHRNPFDHFLMALAQAEHAALRSDDGQRDRYSIKRIRCS